MVLNFPSLSSFSCASERYNWSTFSITFSLYFFFSLFLCLDSISHLPMHIQLNKPNIIMNSIIYSLISSIIRPNNGIKYLISFVPYMIPFQQLFSLCQFILSIPVKRQTTLEDGLPKYPLCQFLFPCSNNNSLQ